MEPIRIPDAILELLVRLFFFRGLHKQLTTHQAAKFWASPVDTSTACLIKVASFTIGIGSSADAFAGGQNGWFWLTADSGHFTTNTPRAKSARSMGATGNARKDQDRADCSRMEKGGS
jgi:hypothetical protein